MKQCHIFSLSFFILLACGLGSVVKETPEDLARARDLIQWIQSKGGEFNDKLELFPEDSNDQTSSLGIFAVEDIPKNESLFQIPPHCFISIDEHTRDNSCTLECKAYGNIVDEMQLGNESEFAPYLRYIQYQSPGRLPSAWSMEGIQLLKQVLGENEQNLPPKNTFDPTNNHWLNFVEGKNASPLEIKAALLAEKYSWDGILVPVYDLMSHSNGYSRNTETTLFEHDEVFEAWAARHIEAGEKIHISFNFCPDCLKDYGTPEILRDYGFVEKYPQVWIFHRQGISFRINHVRNDDGSFSDELQISWISDIPSGAMVKYLEDELERLLSLDSVDAHVDEKEAKVIWEYRSSLIFALEKAIESAYDQRDNICAGRRGTCEVSLEDYDDFEIDSIYEFPERIKTSGSDEIYPDTTVDKKRYKEDFDVGESSYQKMTFLQDKLTKDTCFDLDDTLQQCGSYRPHYHEMMVHYTARFLDSVQRVVFVGGGDSMLLHEIMKYPSLELVVGLELDQMVTRKSFKHFGTQPHWNNEKVQWWFGDAAKSLLMLPQDYFGSFDMVLIDLSETVMAMKVTDKLDIMEAFSLLLKPDGIFLKNQDYMREMSKIFSYTTQINYVGVPKMRVQSHTLGSNNVDFLNRNLKDHGITNLFVKSLDEIEYHHEYVHDYRFNRTIAQRHCNESYEQPEKELMRQENSPGILMILEVENVIVDLNTPGDLKDAVKLAIQKANLTVISIVTSKHSPAIVVLMNEGYIVAHIWAEHKYCAFDIQLWSRFERHEDAKRSIISVMGGQIVSSSFRIITSGMFGIATWKTDEKKRGPRVNRLCDQPTLAVSSSKDDPDTINVIIDESLSLLSKNVSKVLVICGEKKGNDACDSIDVVRNNGNVDDFFVLWTCSELADVNKLSSNFLMKKTDCKKKVVQKLKELVESETEEGTDKINALVIDPSASLVMCEILHEILAKKMYRNKFLSPEIVMMATMSSESERWKKSFLELFRKYIDSDSVYRAEVMVESTKKSVELGIISSGNEMFIQHLHNLTKRTEQRGSGTLVSEIQNIIGGIVYVDPDMVLSPIFLPGDYDQRSPLNQWLSQKPLGRQLVFQFKTKDGRDVAVSPYRIRSAVKDIIYQINDFVLELREFENIGEGYILVAIWSKGTAVVVWDGRNHVSINILTRDGNKKMKELIKNQFKRKARMTRYKIFSYDEHPRGYGGVVNFLEDIEKSEIIPHWAH